jgi:hypothetical protein
MTNSTPPTKRPTPKPPVPTATGRTSFRPPPPSSVVQAAAKPPDGPTFAALVERSLAAALSAIEVYNKPSFAYREEAFAVLIVNAWEVLLKAKLLKDAGNKIECILAIDKNGKPKYSRNAGVPLTIDIGNAMLKARLPVPVAENIKALVEIRDAAVHLCCERDDEFSYLVFTLAAASLKNYARLMNEWFDRSLKEYNFFVLPLAFSYNFRTLDAIELDKRPEAIRDMIRAVAQTQAAMEPGDDHHFVCEIRTEVRAAPKFAEGADCTIAVDPKAGPEATTVFRVQALIDRFPLAYGDLLAKVKAAVPDVKQHQIDAILKAKVKGNEKLSAYNFRYKAQDKRYRETGQVPKGMTVIYNLDAVATVVAELRR